MPARKAPEHTVMEESDDSLVAAAQTIFADDLLPPEPGEEWEFITGNDGVPVDVTEQAPRRKPGIDKMVTVRGGGLYLPVRQRVGWMRQEPVPHPDWTIETQAEKIIEGTFKGNKVEGGYARYKTNIYDETGRLIATGTKTEYSERFLDFVEKAETGSIGRALAVAGYGTEAAIDLDEGYEQERLADAPVAASGMASAGRPINISASGIPAIKPGGHQPNITEPQMKEVARLSRTLGLGWGLIPIMEQVKDEAMPPVADDADAQKIMLDFLRGFSNDEAGQLIQTLTKALNDKRAGEQIHGH